MLDKPNVQAPKLDQETLSSKETWLSLMYELVMQKVPFGGEMSWNFNQNESQEIKRVIAGERRRRIDTRGW